MKEDIALENVPHIASEKCDNIRDVDRVLNKEWLLKKLEELPDNHREIITLRYLEQLSYKEMSEITGKDEGALRVAVMRIIKRLQEDIDREKEIKISVA